MSTEEPWKAALREDILSAAIEVNQAYRRGDVQPWTPMTEAVMAAVMPHMESSFKVGRMKASARIGRRYVQKNLELSRKLRLAREYADYHATQCEDYRYCCDHAPELVTILGEDEGASQAEAEIRARTLREAGWEPCSPEWLAAHPNQCGIALRVPGDGDTSHWHPSSTRSGALLKAADIAEAVAMRLHREGEVTQSNGAYAVMAELRKLATGDS